MKKDEIIRVNDTIQIVNPLFVTRIGYDFTYEDACKEILETYRDDIYTLMRKAKVPINVMNHQAWDKAEKKIVGALAYNLVKTKIKTGNERKVYSELKEELRNKEAVVISKRRTVTGIYFPARGGEEDYEPGGLMEPETHVILEIAIGDIWNREGLQIEQCNIIKKL